jgi:hypothetical protein
LAVKSLQGIQPYLFTVPFLALVALAGVESTGETLKTQDTLVVVEPIGDGVVVRSLSNPADAEAEWIPKANKDDASAALPLTDAVYIGQRKLPVHWRLTGAKRNEGADASEVTFNFVSDDPPLELRSRWRAAAGPGPVEHALTLTNRGSVDVLLPRQSSLSMLIAGGRLEQWWVEKGAGTPTAVGVHRSPIDAKFASSLLSTSYARDNPRDPVPWMAVQDVEHHRGLYVGIESSARVQIDLHGKGDAREKDGSGSFQGILDAGIEPDEAFRTRLAPGESFDAPPIFVGCYTGEVDDGCNRLRRWVDRVLRPPAHDDRYPLLVNNSWGSGMAVDAALARKMIDQSAELGLEMFHIDAGWFRGVGDWVPDRHKFPHGLAPIAEAAHARGLKFGLWVGWTQGGIQTDPTGRHAILSLWDPLQADWFPLGYPRDFKPSDFTGATLCLGDRAAADWCLETLRHVVRDNHLDLLEHDQTMIVDKCGRADHLHTADRGDIAYRAAQGYDRVQDALRAEFPNLLFENCVNGGHQVDFGVVRRTHYVSITDTYDPLSNRRAFYDASYVLPPAMCECYIENHPGKTDANFLYMLRSGMMGWCTIMLDTTKWTPAQHALAKRQFELYKTKLRPLIRDGNLFHVSARPDGIQWDAIQYAGTNRLEGALFAFRGTTPEADHTFVLRGLNPQAIYKIGSADHPDQQTARLGRTLMSAGLTLHLPEPEASDIVLFKADAPD